jgi:hypothetical protein
MMASDAITGCAEKVYHPRLKLQVFRTNGMLVLTKMITSLLPG